MSASEETLTLLRSIDASLKSIDASFKQLAKQRQASAPKAVATDRDLDGRYGDPVLRLMPRDWTGPSFKDRPMSQCPPELLDLAAEMFEYFAKKADAADERTDKGKPVGDYRRQDAARARGWAKRMRDGKHHAPDVATPTPIGNMPEWPSSGPVDESVNW